MPLAPRLLWVFSTSFLRKLRGTLSDLDYGPKNIVHGYLLDYCRLTTFECFRLRV